MYEIPGIYPVNLLPYSSRLLLVFLYINKTRKGWLLIGSTLYQES